jgi:hypothetical protein
MLNDNATHALDNGLIANLEHTVNLQQHKPRAQLIKRRYCHYLLLNDGSRHGSLTFLVVVPSILLLGILHLEFVHRVCQCLALTPTHTKTSHVDLTFLHHLRVDAEKVMRDSRFQVRVKQRKRRM